MPIRWLSTAAESLSVIPPSLDFIHSAAASAGVGHHTEVLGCVPEKLAQAIPMHACKQLANFALTGCEDNSEKSDVGGVEHVLVHDQLLALNSILTTLALTVASWTI